MNAVCVCLATSSAGIGVDHSEPDPDRNWATNVSELESVGAEESGRHLRLNGSPFKAI